LTFLLASKLAMILTITTAITIVLPLPGGLCTRSTRSRGQLERIAFTAVNWEQLRDRALNVTETDLSRMRYNAVVPRTRSLGQREGLKKFADS